MIQPADRVNQIQEYYFSRKLKEVARLKAEGHDIISLAIGSPDMPPSPQTIDKLCEVARDPAAHGYQPTVGIAELRQAMAYFYKNWYDVDLDPDKEIQPMLGSKEGILHITLAFCNPGDEVLLPDPGYPLIPLSISCWQPRSPTIPCVRTTDGSPTSTHSRRWTSAT